MTPIELMRAVKNRVDTFVIRIAVIVLVCAPRHEVEIVRLGSEYGGWWVPDDDGILKFGICCSIGAGEDITFDIELSKKFSTNVIVVDPTPRALQHFKSIQNVDQHSEAIRRLEFAGVGVWDSDTIQRFYAPKNSDHVSHSILNLQSTAEFFEAQCYTVKTILEKYTRGVVPSLLKLDIEGAEHRVIRQMLGDGIFPRVILVEFDDGAIGAMIKTGRLLSGTGYRRIKVEKRNCLFVRS